MKNLVIVESPTKARTISRYLGKDYEIKFSMGHVMDLPKSKLGVDVEHDFEPQLEMVADKKKIIADLRSAAKGAEVIILATDPDREGEAIAANIKEILLNGKKAGSEKFKRIVFHEITEEAIKEAIQHPRDVDGNLVNAQIARRVLDRLVGYQLSPLLWQKVRRGLSAGRVQSVALRLIVEREREIEKFKKEEYFSVHAKFKKLTGDAAAIVFDLLEHNGEKLESQKTHTLYDGEYKVTKTTIDSSAKAEDIVQAIKKEAFYVADISERETKRSPYAPFITSTMQQEASRRFGFSGKRTMSFAQKLYEEGFITYHRTDSITISQQAIGQIRKYVESDFGTKYLSPSPRIFTTKQKNAQEAHEGIRPTKIDSIATGQKLQVEKELGRECAMLYEMIWRRAVASQMADALIQSTTVYADSKGGPGLGADSRRKTGENAMFRMKANGSVLIFDGFLKVNIQALQDTRLPKFVVNEDLKTEDAYPEQHETTPPPRYNDASIIQALEEKGIGRPSTYASIIGTIVDRGYVERLERRFVPTAVGVAVNDFLVSNFSDIDDIPFTADMEDDLDEVASGEKEWVSMMKEFYKPFAKKLGEVKDTKRVKIEVEQTDEQCPECKKGNLVIRTGKFGKFLSCSRFPDCKFTKPLVEDTKLICPKDGGKIIVKKTRKGRKFFGCSNYPKCDFAAWKLEDIKGVSKKSMAEEIKREEAKKEEKTESSESPAQS